MARPIEPTPFLTGKDARRFDRLMKNCTYHPTPKRRINWKQVEGILLQAVQGAPGREQQSAQK